MKKILLLLLLLPNIALAGSMKMIGEPGQLNEVNRTIEIKMFDNYYEPNQIDIKKSIDEQTDNSEYLYVKVLEDLPTFTGMDAKNYTLKTGDTESIPKYNARMLSDAGKVKLVTEVKV